MRCYDDSDRREKTRQSNKRASYGFILARVITFIAHGQKMASSSRLDIANVKNRSSCKRPV